METTTKATGSLPGIDIIPAIDKVTAGLNKLKNACIEHEKNLRNILSEFPAPLVALLTGTKSEQPAEPALAVADQTPDDDDHDTFSPTQLRAWRQSLGLSCAKVANLCDVHRRTISKWEVGEITPSPEHQKKLSEIFRTSTNGCEKIQEELHVVTDGVETALDDLDAISPTKLRALREACGWSQKKVGKLCNVHQSTVSGWELGNASPSNGNLKKLRKIFSVTTGECDKTVAPTITEQTTDDYFKNRAIPLQALRKAHGLTLTALGKMCGVKGKAVSLWEHGVTKPSPSIRNKLHKIFGVMPDECVKTRTISTSPTSLYMLRKAHGLSQREIGELCNVTQSVISAWELNKSTPSIEQQKKLSEIFGVIPDECSTLHTTVQTATGQLSFI